MREKLGFLTWSNYDKWIKVLEYWTQKYVSKGKLKAKGKKTSVEKNEAMVATKEQKTECKPSNEKECDTKNNAPTRESAKEKENNWLA
jgi:hypothetical protein